MTDVFISYCRRDKAFVRALCHSLQSNGHQLWVDWEGIQASEPWREEISKGIRNAKRMVYILSPDTVASPYCDWEVDQAFDLQKKLIPILCRDVDISTVREDVSALQFISFCGEDDFPEALAKLEGAITADLEYDHTFAKLEQRAQEWQKRDRQDGWLRGSELEDAELWLANSAGKMPPPSPLQRDYILASRHERQAELERWQTLYEQSETRRIAAEQNEITAFCKSSEAFFALDRPMDALLESLQAAVRLQAADWAKDLPDLRAQVVGSLQQGLYWVREANRLEGHLGTVRSVSISADGDRIVTASRDTTVRLWHRNGECLAVLNGHENLVRTVVFAPDGQSFLSGSWDSSIRIWSREGALIKRVEGHGDRVLHIAFHPDGDRFASASTDGTVKLWEASGELLTTLELDGIEQRCVAFSPDGLTLASAGRDGHLHLWTIESNRTLVSILSLECSGYPLSTLCFTPDGQWILVGGRDGWIRAWNHERHQLYDCANPGGEIRDIQMIPHRNILMSGGREGTVDLWDLAPLQTDGILQKMTSLMGHSGPVLAVDVDATGQLLLSAGGDRVVRLWRWQSSKLLRCNTGGVGSHGVNFRAAGDQVVVIGQRENLRNVLQVWHRDGHLLHEMAHSPKILNFDMSPQGDLLATSMPDGVIQLWNRDGTLNAECKAHQDWPRQLCFSADGQRLASASDDGTVRVWDRQGQLQRTFQGEGDQDPQRLTCVCFSPDGQSILAGSKRGIVYHWGLDGTLLRMLHGHGDMVLAVAFSADGQSIISAGDDRTTRIWQLDGTLLHTLNCQRSVRTIDVSPDGKAIAAGCRDGNIRFWSLEGTFLSTVQTRSGQILQVRFSPDGQCLAATGDEGVLTLWTLDGFDDAVLERLVHQGLDWCHDYLQTNPNGRASLLRDGS